VILYDSDKREIRDVLRDELHRQWVQGFVEFYSDVDLRETFVADDLVKVLDTYFQKWEAPCEQLHCPDDCDSCCLDRHCPEDCDGSCQDD
jgi:hypothetical protein